MPTGLLNTDKTIKSALKRILVSDSREQLFVYLFVMPPWSSVIFFSFTIFSHKLKKKINK